MPGRKPAKGRAKSGKKAQPKPRPMVVVKFREGMALPYADDVGDFVESLGLGPWRKLKRRYPGIRIGRAVAAEPEQIEALVEEARRRNPEYNPPSFLLFFGVSVPRGAHAATIARTIRKWPGVELAYVSYPPKSPAVTPNDPLYAAGQQGYLSAAPKGINAPYAWNLPGGDGQDQTLVDIENGWKLDHPDLLDNAQSERAKLLAGTNPVGRNQKETDAFRDHGTKVLGVVCASDNAIDCLGIVPNLSRIGVISWTGLMAWTYDVAANAIWEAIRDLVPLFEVNQMYPGESRRMRAGDVLLLEMTMDAVDDADNVWSDMPIEASPLRYQYVELATVLDVIVVEAAGNAGNPIDGFEMISTGKKPFDPSSSAYVDSGAILVGAATSTLPRWRSVESNFSARVDCHAWGDQVTTLSAVSGTTSSFGGTSSASAIVAGAALAVQGMRDQAGLPRYGALDMRAVLGDKVIGTPLDGGVTDVVGVMPDLMRITQVHLGIVPDVYMRDFVGDAGLPHSGPLAMSPDIIVRKVPVLNPQATFTTAAAANSDALSDSFLTAGDLFVYVRVLNRGGQPANNVKADVFYSPAATLLTQSLWQHIGSVVIPSVPSGNVLTVSDAIKWNAMNLTWGHYCLVAVLETGKDPAPAVNAQLDWDVFKHWISHENNVTWRNLNFFSAAELAALRGNGAMAFLAPGSPVGTRLMRLEWEGTLPPGARVTLEVPGDFMEMSRARTAGFERDPERNVFRRRVAPQGRQPLLEGHFPEVPSQELQLLVKLPEGAVDRSWQFSIRQLDRHQEVGRVTWRIVPEEPRD